MLLALSPLNSFPPFILSVNQTKPAIKSTTKIILTIFQKLSTVSGLAVCQTIFLAAKLKTILSLLALLHLCIDMLHPRIFLFRSKDQFLTLLVQANLLATILGAANIRVHNMRKIITRNKYVRMFFSINCLNPISSIFDFKPVPSDSSSWLWYNKVHKNIIKG
jgi:hypothetical protein